MLGCHQYAFFKSTKFVGTIIDDSRLEKCLRLIDSLHTNWWWGIAYAVLICVAVGFSAIRRHPRWSTWLLFLMLAVPWFYYIYACAYIAANAVG